MNSFEVKNSNINNLGLFTKQPFKKGQVILKFVGKHISENEIDSLTSDKADSCLEFDIRKYLLINNDNSYFINHSCNPNCLIKVSVNQVFLLALMDINIGDELFFDYSTTSTDSPDEYSMKCNCGNYHCRENISGFNTVSEKQQEEYIKAGAVPQYILNYFGINT